MYKLQGSSILRIDGAVIPMANGNADYEAYKVWVAEGNAPASADQSPAPDYSALRAKAYREESDPLFFQEQRGEVPVGTWLAKVEEIKARWPQ